MGNPLTGINWLQSKGKDRMTEILRAQRAPEQEDGYPSRCEGLLAAQSLEQALQVDATRPVAMPEEGLVRDEPVLPHGVATREDREVELSVEEDVRIHQEDEIVLAYVAGGDGEGLDPIQRCITW